MLRAAAPDVPTLILLLTHSVLEPPPTTNKASGDAARPDGPIRPALLTMAEAVGPATLLAPKKSSRPVDDFRRLRDYLILIGQFSLDVTE
jgi:hypothetical protein